MQTDRILNSLIEDKHLQIKNSQSAEYYEPTLESSINKIYEYCQKQILEKQLPINFQVVQDPMKKLNSIKQCLSFFFEIRNDCLVQKQKECQDCSNYERHLQKLENDVRQHIRLQHQLKLYQESLEEKIEEIKKQNQEKLSALNATKRDFQEYKRQSHKNIAPETQRNKIQKNKPEHNNKIQRTSSIKKQMKNYYHEGKQNASTRNKSQGKKDHRKSIEKKQSKDKFRTTMISMRSNKQLPLTEKILNRQKQEKKKAIQAKFIL